MGNPVGGASSSYVIGYTASGSGALTGLTGTVLLRARAGTVFPTNNTSYAFTVNGVNVGVASSTGVLRGGSAVLLKLGGGAIPAGATVQITASGVTNAPPGDTSVTVSTSSDLLQVTTPTVALSGTPGPAPTAASSPTAVLSSAAGERGGRLAHRRAGRQHHRRAHDGHGHQSRGAAAWHDPVALHPAVTVTNVTTGLTGHRHLRLRRGPPRDPRPGGGEPGEPGHGHALQRRRADHGRVALAVDVGGHHPGQRRVRRRSRPPLRAHRCSPSHRASDASEVTAAMAFTASGSGALPLGVGGAGPGGEVIFTGPAGTVFPTGCDSTQQSYLVTDVTAGWSIRIACGATWPRIAGSSVSIPVPQAVAAGDCVTVSAANVRMPGKTGGTFGVATTADTLGVTTASTIAPDGKAATPTLTPSNLARFGHVTGVVYTAGFKPSATGAMPGKVTVSAIGVAGGQITLAGPVGMAWPTTASRYSVTNSTQGWTANAGLVVVTNGGATTTFDVPQPIAAADQMVVTVRR